MAFTVKIEVKYNIGQSVFRRCDEEKHRFFVVGYFVDAQGIMYKIKGDGECSVYDYEIADYESRHSWMN